MIHTFTIRDQELQFEVTPGVFAQYGLDIGSRIMLQELPPLKGERILDLGCGCGFIGLTLAAIYPQSKVYMVDSDIRAVRLSRKNADLNELKNVQVELADVAVDQFGNTQYDVVVSNPPTHQGTDVLMSFIQAAHNSLRTGGEAFFVVNRMESVLKKMHEIFGNSEKIVRQQGYIVFRAVK